MVARDFFGVGDRDEELEEEEDPELDPELEELPELELLERGRRFGESFRFSTIVLFVEV